MYQSYVSIFKRHILYSLALILLIYAVFVNPIKGEGYKSVELLLIIMPGIACFIASLIIAAIIVPAMKSRSNLKIISALMAIVVSTTIYMFWNIFSSLLSDCGGQGCLGFGLAVVTIWQAAMVSSIATLMVILQMFKRKS